MYDHPGDLTVILIIIWWLQKLGRDSARKQATPKTDMERFNLKRLREMEVRKQFQIEISNMFEALENLNNSKDINRAWENMKENIKISAKKTLALGVYGWKQAKMQWLQDPKQSNLDNLNNASKHFRNKKREYLKAKIKELETNSKNKNIRELYRGINDFKKGYQPRTDIVKDEKGDLVADCHSILTR
jgi:hypothetical protein